MSFNFGMKSDTIQFGLLIVAGIGMLMGFAGWADARYAKSVKVNQLSWEVHALYLTIPESTRAQIEQRRTEFELAHDSNP